MIDWNAVGAIAEVVGAVAVMATLVYLARQIRHGSRSVEAWKLLFPESPT